MFSFLGACASPTAMLGPVYTLSSTGNVLQAGLSYGSSEIVTAYTGKTPMENLEEFTSNNLSKDKQENNIQKQTLESKEFLQLVKNKIQKTKEIIESSNQ